MPSPSEGYLIIDPDNASTREVIHYTSKTGNSVVLPGTGDRGLDGTTAQSHAQNTTVRMEYTTSHFDALKNGYAITPAAISATLLASNAVNSGNVDWASATGKVWWQELGRTTLSATAATISLQGLTARTHLKVYATMLATATLNPVGNFNADTANNYAYRLNLNSGSDTSVTSHGSFSAGTGTLPGCVLFDMDVVNQSAVEKLFFSRIVQANASGAGNGVDHRQADGKWSNTSSQITRVDLTTSVGNFLPNSELIVLGHD